MPVRKFDRIATTGVPGPGLRSGPISPLGTILPSASSDGVLTLRGTRGRLMSGYIPWSWADSLGGVRPNSGRWFRVQEIAFGLVRDRCSELGLREGQEIRWRSRTAEQVVFEIPGGHVRDLEVPYSWFVRVVPIALQANPVDATGTIHHSRNAGSGTSVSA